MSRFKIFPSGNLQIANVKFSDGGVYRCAAFNPITNEVKNNSKTVVLKVHGKLQKLYQNKSKFEI